tara:strand:- start:25058 stop:25459 length:402 start_codon:yes stop_codon:yes gene_type:complete
MPVQRQSRKFKDISSSFQVSPLTYDLLAITNESAISRSVKNLVLTSPGEKFFEPELGSRVNSLLFEPLDNIIASEVRDEIENVINRFEPRVDLQNVTVVPDFDNGELNVTIRYDIVGIEVQPQQLTFALQPAR